MAQAGSPFGGETERLGDLLVEAGLVTETQLKDALRTQAATSEHVHLGELLIQQGVLTREQLRKALDDGRKWPRLGDVLVRVGAITAEQLQSALAQQRKHKIPLGQLLVRLGHITDERMRQALGMQLNIPYIDLDRMGIDPALAKLINRSYARKRLLVPVSCLGDSLTVCMDDPTDRVAIEELGRTTRYNISVVTASREAIENAFARLYTGQRTEASGSGGVAEKLELVTEDTTLQAKSKYVAEYRQHKNADALVRHLLSTAIEHRCSDIHIETLSNRVSIRFRIDGMLESLRLGELQNSMNDGGREIVSRLKILAKLDIAEKRRPQDGSFRVRIERNGEQFGVDLRMSVIPSVYGESVVLRILDRTRAPGTIDALDFPRPMSQRFQQLLRRPSGILLVTGPTGSGKSTTLYAALKTLYRPQIRVLTVEDPIEYVYEQFSQSEVNEQIGNTFASYLRAFLRHDPEVIMVGEVRDEETAEIAFRAAQTGHLLLSTLHTNTAVAAVTRLRDMKIDPNLIASCLLGVVGQRLVREVCSGCKAEYLPSEELLREFFGATGPRMRVPFYKGKGCDRCHFTGYHGRTAIVELWVPNEEDVILIAKGASFDELRVSAARNTYSMAECATDLLSKGRTNLEELIRMMPYQCITEMRTNLATLGRGAGIAAAS
jgi:type II secretory ATPase GspE/PulE/Tfp pilus assembly ATPase PilB-like protein